MPHALPGDSVPHVAQEDRSRSGAGEPYSLPRGKWKKRPARLHWYIVICTGGGCKHGQLLEQLLRASDARLRVACSYGLEFESIAFHLVVTRAVLAAAVARWGRHSIRTRGRLDDTCVAAHAPVRLPATTVFLREDDRGRRRAQDLGEWPVQQRLDASARSDLRHADRTGVWAATFRHRLAAHRRCPLRFTRMANHAMRPSVPEPANLTQAPLRPPVPLRCRDGRALRPHPSQAFRAQFIPHVSQALLASCPHEMSLQT